MDSKLLRCLLPIIRNGLRRGVGIEDLEGCGGYEQVQDALFWMEDKGLSKLSPLACSGATETSTKPQSRLLDKILWITIIRSLSLKSKLP